MNPSTTQEEFDAKFVGKYYGADKIATITELEEKTPRGLPIVRITFETVLKENGEVDELHEKAKVLPVKTLLLGMTDAPIDLSSLFAARMSAMIPDVIETMKEYDLQMFELDIFTTSLKNQIENIGSRAYNFLLTGDDSNYIPGWDARKDTSLHDYFSVIKKIPEKK